jgi:hypothetical protein
MRRIDNFFKISVLTAGVMILSACLGIQVYRHVDDPEPYFDRAYREIDRLESYDRGRRDGAREICVLVHDAADGELVRVNVPLWLVRPVADVGVEVVEHDRRLRKWEDRYDFDRGALRHLKDCGLGLVLDIQEENDRVLVWLR